MVKTTNTLDAILKKTKPDKIGEYLRENEESLLEAESPFAEYMRLHIRQKGLQQQEVFINADMSEGCVCDWARTLIWRKRSGH